MIILELEIAKCSRTDVSSLWYSGDKGLRIKVIEEDELGIYENLLLIC